MRFTAIIEIDVEFVTPNIDHYTQHLREALTEAVSLCTTRSTRLVRLESIEITDDGDTEE